METWTESIAALKHDPEMIIYRRNHDELLIGNCFLILQQSQGFVLHYKIKLISNTIKNITYLWILYHGNDVYWITLISGSIAVTWPGLAEFITHVATRVCRDVASHVIIIIVGFFFSFCDQSRCDKFQISTRWCKRGRDTFASLLSELGGFRDESAGCTFIC